MSNKEKIAELQDLINRSFDKFNSVVTGAREELDDLINSTHAEIVKLKKEDEVKPVFPDGADSVRLNILTYKEDCALGLSAYDAAGLGRIMTQLKARAYVIEAINRANGGDNGFKYGSENNLISFNHEAQVLKRTDFGYLQEAESCLYIRNVHKALSLLSQKAFREAYKTMLGIK